MARGEKGATREKPKTGKRVVSGAYGRIEQKNPDYYVRVRLWKFSSSAGGGSYSNSEPLKN